MDIRDTQKKEKKTIICRIKTKQKQKQEKEGGGQEMAPEGRSKNLDQNTQFQKFFLFIYRGLYPLVMDSFLDLETKRGNIPI